MNNFLKSNFLLKSKEAEELYHNYAKDMPIYDYHCHLLPNEIAEDRKFNNITELWLEDDHYKWRAMRSLGVDESYITGNKSAKEKFLKWAEVVPKLIGNPLYHWTHLELKRFFNIDDILNEETASRIWIKANKYLEDNNITAKKIIESFNVHSICTTDDPIDDLGYHRKIKEDENFNVLVTPTFRPDLAIDITSSSFYEWLDELAFITNRNINSYETFILSLYDRIDYFDELGCRISDHGLDYKFYTSYTEEECKEIFNKHLNREHITEEEALKIRTSTLVKLGIKYKEKDWAMQLHIGAYRNTNTKMFEKIGPNTGFDTIGDQRYLKDLMSLFDELNYRDNLPKSIIYNLNPKDNDIVAAFIGNYQSGIPGKIQFGSAWWFNDHKLGMESQIKTLASIGVLASFVGMLTDSRSLLSYTRHEYFRRILCNIFGDWLVSGEMPYDIDFAGKLVEDICFNNIYLYLK